MWRSRFLFMLGLAVVAFLSVVLSLQTFRATGEPWQLTFMGEGSRLQLAIVCEKPLIPITEIVLDNIALNSPIKHQVVFTDLDIALPLGQLTFADLTMLPGRITLSLFDQEIDLIQRALMINGIEYEWGTPITLQPRLSRESDS